MKPYYLFFGLTLIFTSATACPICNTAIAKKVRASLFGPELPYHLAVTIAPFALFALIVVLIYTGGRLPFQSKKRIV